MTQRKRKRTGRKRPSDGTEKKAPHKLIADAVILLGALAAVVAILVARTSSGPARHVVLVAIDTLRHDAVGCYGNKHGTTPHIDGIAEEGVRFDQAVSTSGWTLPAFASLMTGAWPTIHGARGKQVELTVIREELPMLADILKDKGFHTFGVANAAFVSPMLGFDRGFDVFDHRHAYNWDIRRADETIDTALQWLRDHHTESTFVFIHLFDPHLAYDPPPGYRFKFTAGRMEPAPPVTLEDCRAMLTANRTAPPVSRDIAYIRGVYEGEVNFVDAQFGRLVQELRALGIYDQTTLILTSDHGEEFWDHGGFEHGHTLYDELIRVLLVVKPPAEVQPVTHTVGAQVRLLDIGPTIFDLLGIDKPDSFVGVSLVPMMMGNDAADRIAFSESTLYGADKIAWRIRQYKYIVDLNPAAPVPAELYDWRNDPGETNNLIDERPDLAERLRSELTAFSADLVNKARSMSSPVVKNMSPAEIQRLRSLGYIDR